jgi:hypothetical protein
MLSKIQQTYADVSNSRLWTASIKPFLKYSVSSLACASFAKRMWITANQLDIDPHAREQVFQAGQRLFALVSEQRDTSVNSFAAINRLGALTLGLVSTVFALKGAMIVWGYYNRSMKK